MDQTNPLSTRLLLLLLVWPVLVLGLGGAYLIKRDDAAFAEQLRMRPPVAVIDIDRIVHDRQSGTSIEQALDESNAMAASLRKAGFLVIRRSNVISAPAAIQVPKPEERP